MHAKWILEAPSFLKLGPSAATLQISEPVRVGGWEPSTWGLCVPCILHDFISKLTSTILAY
jgi:hypothetical protein